MPGGRRDAHDWYQAGNPTMIGPMTALTKPRMSVDEFLAWAEANPGRYELFRGEVYAMSPEDRRARQDQGCGLCQRCSQRRRQLAGFHATSFLMA